MKKRFVFVALLILILVSCTSTSSKPAKPSSNEVTLDAKYGREVPMYDQQGFETHAFPNGTICTLLDDEMYFFEGGEDAYHKLRCDGKTGFVYRGDIDF